MSLDGQTVAVHIVVFTNAKGFIPGKKQIDHMCNNRMCVNEDHLQMVTHKKNQRLRIERSKTSSFLHLRQTERESHANH
jgi:HNH endonuclease